MPTDTENTQRVILDDEIVSRLKRLETPKRPGFLAKLFHTYTRSADEYLDAIASALEHGDAEACRSAAHAFKGGSLNIGASRLSALLAEAEGHARSGALELIVVEPLRHAHEEACVALRETLGITE